MNKSNSTKSMTIAAAALALCMAAGGALAQGRPGGDDRGRDGRPGNSQGRGADRHDDRRDNRFSHNRPMPRGMQQDYRDGRHFDRKGYDRPAEWRRGGRLPPEYRGRNYVVDDYRAYRLQAPPRGYQWVGIGGEFALAAIATGLIAQIIVSQ